jgi:maltose alpha-D-glucosyltransferase/alpha-amylase
VLTLAPYGFYWFELRQVVAPVTARTATAADTQVEVASLLAGAVWDSILEGGLRSLLERRVLPQFLQRQRWFAGKAREVSAVRLADWATIRSGQHPAFVTILDVAYRDGGHERYVLPLAMADGAAAAAIRADHPGALVAQITGARKGILFDGLFDDETCATLLTLVQNDRDVRLSRGVIHGISRPLHDHVPVAPATPITRGADQSNTSVLFGKRHIMKVFRRIEPGEHPDLEMTEVLLARGFTRVPPIGGALQYAEPGAASCAVAMLQQYVHNQGNGWQVAIDELGRYFERALTLPLTVPAAAPPDGAPPTDALPLPSDSEVVGTYLTLAAALGRRTGEMHARLAETAGPPAFAPERLTADDLRAMSDAMRHHATEQLTLLELSIERLDERQRLLARTVLEARDELLQAFDVVSHVRDAGFRIRCHGDYHLGQVLVTEGDIVILDFEGEPSRPLHERRARHPALRDVAGMLRSFDYAALVALNAATLTRPEDLERLAPWADLWDASVVKTYLHEYRASVADLPIVPPDDHGFDRLLVAFLVDKALYELTYELNSRPDWVQIPLAGLVRLRARLRSTRLPSGMPR